MGIGLNVGTGSLLLRVFVRKVLSFLCVQYTTVQSESIYTSHPLKTTSPVTHFRFPFLIFFFFFYGGCVGHSFANVVHFVFLRDVRIRTQRFFFLTRLLNLSFFLVLLFCFLYSVFRADMADHFYGYIKIFLQRIRALIYRQ